MNHLKGLIPCTFRNKLKEIKNDSFIKKTEGQSCILALFKLNTCVLSECGIIIDTILVILRH